MINAETAALLKTPRLVLPDLAGGDFVQMGWTEKFQTSRESEKVLAFDPSAG